jgi:nucleotide-binding universal stress UspA family protein
MPPRTPTSAGTCSTTNSASCSRAGRCQSCCTEINSTTIVLEGIPHQALCDMAKTVDPGLIVIATHGHTGWEHALIGSTAERVVRHAPCPVLVVR